MKKGKISIPITVALVCFLLSMTIFMQFKVVQETEETDIDTMQITELRQELANWKKKYEDTKGKYDETVETLKTYQEETLTDNQTKITLENELEKLELSLGKTDVQGEGIVLTLSEKSVAELAEDEEIISIMAKDLIYIVNYLKDAGAEAISINDERIVNITDIVDIGNSIKVNSKHLRSDIFVIKAIGNSSYLESSIFGKGGYVEQLNTTGINADIQRLNRVQIQKYTGNYEIKYMEELEK